jgi:Thiol-activated cytolysin
MEDIIMLTNNDRIRGKLPLCMILGIILILAGCSSDKKTPTAPTGNTSEISAYLQALPPWEDFANLQDTATEPAGDVIAEMSNDILCTTTPYSITQNPDEIVTFGSAPDVMYLGSLIQGNSYLGGLGTMEELPIRQRAPLTIAIKLFSGTDISRVVQNPDAASIQSALSDMVSAAAGSGHQSGSRISYNYSESYSSIQAALSLGVSWKYMGASGRSALSFQASHSTHTITALFKQIMFEAYIVRPQTPGQFFSSSFSKELLDEQIALGNVGPNNLPVYVARIQYGRMLMYSMTSSSTSYLLKAAVDASYNGLASVDVSIRSQVQSVLQNAEVKVATIGGSASSALTLLRSGQLQDYFTTDDPITTAEPLAYAVCNLADGSLAQVSEMTAFDVQECSDANAICYLNKTEWQMAVAQLVGEGHIIEFPTTAENLSTANEMGWVPGQNNNMGNVLTFDSSVTHYPFTFHLRATEGGAGLVFEDQESGPAFGAMDQERSISIGDVGDQENDDFDIAIPVWNNNAAVFAIGFTVGDNEYADEEYVEVTGVNNFIHRFGKTSPNCPGLHGFVGIVATMPITLIHFNEGSGGDDIFVRDFCFGVIDWTP